jgi:hypothetical protein
MSSTQTAILAAPAPLAGRDTWEAVIAAAGYRCQCTRPHKSHKNAKPDGRCEAAHGTAGVRLVAGPETPSHDPARAMTDAGAALMAWCGPCWDLEVNAARRRHSNEINAHAHDGMDGLF